MELYLGYWIIILALCMIIWYQAKVNGSSVHTDVVSLIVQGLFLGAKRTTTQWDDLVVEQVAKVTGVPLVPPPKAASGIVVFDYDSQTVSADEGALELLAKTPSELENPAIAFTTPEGKAVQPHEQARASQTPVRQVPIQVAERLLYLNAYPMGNRVILTVFQ